MAETDPPHPPGPPQEAALRRMRLLIAVLGAAGCLLLSFFRGPRFGLGFLLGATASFFSFWRWQRVADSLASPASARPGAWRLAVRFGIFVLAGYAIVKYLQVNMVAVVFGLLAATAAALIEIVWELLHGI